jgi:outer membrane immunogenic protein
MKPLLIGSTLALALVAAAPAGAADIVPGPVYPGSPALAVPSWTGFYVGANAGYSWGQTGNVRNKQGFAGGGQLGYDYQFGHFVLGLEADLNWRKATHDVTSTAPNGTDVTSYHSEQDWFGTVRPRLGFTIYNLMIYGTGGFLYGDIEHQVTESRVTVPGASRTGSVSGVRPGWTAGAGIEWALYQWIVGVEWLHLDYTKATITFPAETLAGIKFPAQSGSFHDRSEIVRLKLNYKFGRGPIIARD